MPNKKIEIREPGNKKQDILKFIQKNSETQNPFIISRTNIINKFRDKYYPESKIIELLDDLEQDDILSSNTVSFDIVYPDADKKEIKKKFVQHIVPYNFYNIAVIIAIIIVILTSIISKKYFGASLLITLVFIIGIYIMDRIIRYIKRKTSLIQKINWKMILYNLVSVLIIILITFLYSHFIIKEEEYSTALLLGSITAGIVVGSLIYKATIPKNKN